MADIKYLKFCLGTYFKLFIFLLLSFAAYFALSFAPAPIDKLGPAAVMIILNWFFLTYIEGGQRSFFSKGYMVENIVPGALCGFIPLLVLAVLVLTGKAQFSGINSSFDLTASFLYMLRTGFFISLAVFGYFYHIICKDFGAIAAVIISAVLYTLAELFLFGNISTSAFIHIGADGTLSSTILIFAVNILLTGILAGMLPLCLGDMRSATAFICFTQLCRLAVYGGGDTSPLLRMTGDADFSGSIIYTLILIISIIISIISYSRSKN